MFFNQIQKTVPKTSIFVNFQPIVARAIIIKLYQNYFLIVVNKQHMRKDE